MSNVSPWCNYRLLVAYASGETYSAASALLQLHEYEVMDLAGGNVVKMVSKSV